MAEVTFDETGVRVGDTFLSWTALDSMRNKFRFNDSVLVKVGFSYGRVSDLYDEGIYDRDQWAKIKMALEGSTAYFSDFAGKHSETSVEFWRNVSVEEITNVEEIIQFHAAHGMSNSNLEIIADGLVQAQENGEIDDDYNRIIEDEEE